MNRAETLQVTSKIYVLKEATRIGSRPGR